mmetsp:Transcript_26489/g.37710  ORF Transcript_26489/g.37710 Transcript_26489/m.37710 type:complete len:119 (-) Transcript_26489:47-403(-)
MTESTLMEDFTSMKREGTSRFTLESSSDLQRRFRPVKGEGGIGEEGEDKEGVLDDGDLNPVEAGGRDDGEEEGMLPGTAKSRVRSRPTQGLLFVPEREWIRCGDREHMAKSLWNSSCS